MNTKRHYQPDPADDFRGLDRYYVKTLGDNAFIIGSMLILLSIPAILLPILFPLWGWLAVAPGLVACWAGIRSLTFACRAWDAAK